MIVADRENISVKDIRERNSTGMNEPPLQEKQKCRRYVLWKNKHKCRQGPLIKN